MYSLNENRAPRHPSLNTDQLFSELRSKTTGLWFETFLKFTNQKYITGKVIKNLFLSLKEQQEYFTPHKVIDVGCGEGELALKVLHTLKTTSTNLIYYGIDNEQRFLDTLHQGLNQEQVKHRLFQGDCFGQDLNLLPNNADVILASNIAYYASNISDFISSILAKMNSTSTFISIHESSSSIPNTLRTKYAAPVKTRTALEISSYLTDAEVDFYEFTICSKINFPKDYKQLIVKLLKLNTHNHLYKEDELTPDLLQLKMLLEFIVQIPLEQLKFNGMLNSYVADILAITNQHGGFLPVYSSATVVYKDNILTRGVESKNETYISR